MNRQVLLGGAGNARLINVSGKLLGAHVAHAGVMVFWCWCNDTYSKYHTLFQRSLYMSKVVILLQHLATLGWGIGPGGEIVINSTHTSLLVLFT